MTHRLFDIIGERITESDRISKKMGVKETLYFHLMDRKLQEFSEDEGVVNQTKNIIKKYRVTEIAIETLFFAKNAKSVMKVSEAIGVIKVCGKNNGLAVAEYTPLNVKMALVGYGRAEKEQVEIMVRNELNLDENISPSHASDAVAVALTHGFTMKTTL